MVTTHIKIAASLFTPIFLLLKNKSCSGQVRACFSATFYNSDRYDYLIRKVADFEKIYLIYGNFGEMYTEFLNGEESILVFPEKEFAQMFVEQNSSGRIKEMNIHKFIEWLDRDSDEKIRIAVFLNDQKDTKIVNSAEFKADLVEELKQYQ